MQSADMDKGRLAIRLCGGRVGPLVPRGQGWVFLFIEDSRGCQIGRLTFLHGKLESIKSYKRSYHLQVDETDLIFMRMWRYWDDSVLVPTDVFWGMVEEAERLRLVRIEEIQAWRDANPPKGMVMDRRTGELKPKKRKRIEGYKVRYLLGRLVDDYQKAA